MENMGREKSSPRGLWLPSVGAFPLKGAFEDFLVGKHHNYNCF